MKSKQRGFVAAIIPLIIAGIVWVGAVGGAVVNAENHPEVSKAGRK